MITTRSVLSPAEEARSKQDLIKLVDKDGEHLCSYPVPKGTKSVEVRHRSADGQETFVTFVRTGKVEDDDYHVFKEK